MNPATLITKAIYVAVISLSLASLWPSIGGQAAVGKRPSARDVPSSKMFDAKRLLRDIETLSADDMGGRSDDSPGMEKARAFVEKRLQETGISPVAGSTKQNFDYTPRRSSENLRGVNFFGMIKGKSNSGKHIVVTAHYDHDGIKKGEIYNGADDNASGTAALFAIAQYFKKHQPNHSMLFVALDAEEKGLLGARHFLKNLPIAKESILLNVNVDMIARSDKGELYAAGTYHYPHLKPALEEAQKKARVKLLLGHDRPEQGRHDWTFQSDHGAFHREKIPFVYFGVEDHKDYHKPSDDFANIHPEFYVRAVETIIEAVRSLDRSR